MGKYMQYQAAKSMRNVSSAGGGAGDAAGTGVGLGAGMGMGVGMAGMISQAMAGPCSSSNREGGAGRRRRGRGPRGDDAGRTATYLKVAPASESLITAR